MPVEMWRIAQILEGEKIRFQMEIAGEERSQITVCFKTDHYVDREDNPSLELVIRIRDDGHLLIISAPYCYTCPEGENREAVLETLLVLSYVSPLLTFALDPSDGEIRARVELPIEDGELTTLQLMRPLMSLVTIIDVRDRLIRRAIAAGRTPTVEDLTTAIPE